ncbi:MAG TPA: hypothetical protein PLD84_10390 [Chitinophagales bacterium]|nr:hypothetical protein [Chitinophagales bacterium]
MKTFFSNPDQSIIFRGNSKKWVLSLLTVLSVSFTSLAQEHDSLAECGNKQASTASAEELIQQWTEEMNSHVPQLNVSAKLSYLLDATTSKTIVERQLSNNSQKLTENTGNEKATVTTIKRVTSKTGSGE